MSFTSPDGHRWGGRQFSSGRVWVGPTGVLAGLARLFALLALAVFLGGRADDIIFSISPAVPICVASRGALCVRAQTGCAGCGGGGGVSDGGTVGCQAERPSEERGKHAQRKHVQEGIRRGTADSSYEGFWKGPGNAHGPVMGL